MSSYQSDNLAFRIRVEGVVFYWMVYLSQRNDVCSDPPVCVLLLGQAFCRVAARPPTEGMWLLKCVNLGVQQERALNQCEHWRASGYCFTHTHITVHTFPPICCFPTPTPVAKCVRDSTYRCTRLGGTKPKCPRVKMDGVSSFTHG